MNSFFEELKENRRLTIIIILGFFLRLLFSVFTLIKGLNYYEYGIIIENFLAGNGYAYTFSYFREPITVPSAYMPPGYVFFLYPFSALLPACIKDFAVLFFQNLLSCLSVYLLYKLTLRFFNKETAIVTALLFSVLPEFVFISNTITPTTLFHILFLLLIFSLLKEDSNVFTKINNGIIAGFLTGIISLIRGEFLLYAALIFVYFLSKRKFQFLMQFSLLILVINSPWIIRNYMVFDSFVPSSTNFGLNFYRGHNIYETGDWGDEKILAELNNIQNKKNFELKMSKIFLNRSLEMIREYPSFEVMNSLRKILHLWIISPIGFQNSYLPSLIIWILLLPFIFWSLIRTFSIEKFKFIYIFIIYFNIIAVLFFVLIRYQIMFKPLLLPFGAYGIVLFAKHITKQRIIVN